jgi:hypothetical protein
VRGAAGLPGSIFDPGGEPGRGARAKLSSVAWERAKAVCRRRGCNGLDPSQAGAPWSVGLKAWSIANTR